MRRHRLGRTGAIVVIAALSGVFRAGSAEAPKIIFYPWVKACFNGTDKRQTCFVARNFGNPCEILGSLAISEKEGEADRTLAISLRPVVTSSGELRVRVDRGTPIVLQCKTNGKFGCTAQQVSDSSDLILTLKAAKQFTIEVPEFRTACLYAAA